MTTPRQPASPGEEAARRQAERDAARAARQAEALRANLQRRKVQARERSSLASDTVDGPVSELQKKDSL